MSKPELLFEGSVKNVLKIPQTGDYIFEFSDRFSVFDWGAMPDTLDGKGQALATMANFFFDYLGKPKTWSDWRLSEELTELNNSSLLKSFKENGMNHHGVGLGENKNQYVIKAVDILEPEYKGNGQWDYSIYKDRPEECLVPLEVIFRFGVPKGSSLLKRTADQEYVKELGLTKTPETGDKFTSPVIEFSTKLEPSDRFVSYNDAKELAGLTEKEFQNLRDFVALTALRLKDIFSEVNVELWDGKFEFAFGKRGSDNERSFTLVDSIGPDELRLIYKGTQLSKETLRKFYRSSEWYDVIEKSKVLAEKRGDKNWKDVCLSEFNIQPPALDTNLKNACEQMYQSLAQSICQKFDNKKVFENCWDLDQVVNKLAADQGA